MLIKKIKLVFFCVLFFGYGFGHAQKNNALWKDLVNRNDKVWLQSEEALKTAHSVLLYQRDVGGWPKNIQMQLPLTKSEEIAIAALKSNPDDCTIDNGATVSEIIFLSKIYNQTLKEKYKKSIIAGINYLIQAQYDNGGWPQYYPLQEGYYSHITYNDNAMYNVLHLLKQVNIKNTYLYNIVPQDIKEKAAIAFNKGISCILKTQYLQNETLTAWCAQYDEVLLTPAHARSYELPSLSAEESANIVLLLMDIENPSKEIINAINNAVEWFRKTKITNLKEVTFYNEEAGTTDKKIIYFNNAKPLWARFTELETNKPFFCDRDGVKKDSLSQIGYERRNGYAWYTTGPQKVLERYDEWRKENNPRITDKRQVIVSLDGTGDFYSVQEAINSCKSFPYERITIFIRNGVYKEKIKIHEWNSNLKLIGEDRDKTIITFDDYFNKIGLGRNSTFLTYTMLVEANDIVLENLTIENSSGEVGQAVALSVTSTRIAVVNCKLLGNQDTLYASGIGKQYYKDCYIEGTTDFIFGSATAYFDNCHIHSKSDSFITAASTPEHAEYGFVFNYCSLTAAEGISKVYLGRPWRIYAKTVFMNCRLGGHILPEGWNNWSKPEAEERAFYAEFQNTGEGAVSDKRVKWSHILTKKEAKKITIENIIGEKPSYSKLPWYENI